MQKLDTMIGELMDVMLEKFKLVDKENKVIMLLLMMFSENHFGMKMY